MPLFSFFARRFLTGTVARGVTGVLMRRFKMSPGVANIAFMVLTEVLARATEKSGASAGKTGAGKTGAGKSGRFGRR